MEEEAVNQDIQKGGGHNSRTGKIQIAQKQYIQPNMPPCKPKTVEETPPRIMLDKQLVLNIVRSNVENSTNRNHQTNSYQKQHKTSQQDQAPKIIIQPQSKRNLNAKASSSPVSREVRNRSKLFETKSSFQKSSNQQVTLPAQNTQYSCGGDISDLTTSELNSHRPVQNNNAVLVAQQAYNSSQQNQAVQRAPERNFEQDTLETYRESMKEYGDSETPRQQINENPNNRPQQQSCTLEEGSGPQLETEKCEGPSYYYTGQTASEKAILQNYASMRRNQRQMGVGSDCDSPRDPALFRTKGENGPKSKEFPQRQQPIPHPQQSITVIDEGERKGYRREGATLHSNTCENQTSQSNLEAKQSNLALSVRSGAQLPVATSDFESTHKSSEEIARESSISQVEEGSPKNNQTLKGTDKSQMLGEEYCLLKDLGEGTFGNVKLGKHLSSGQMVAVKILEKDRITEQADVERVIREIKILKSIRHSQIIKLYEIIETQARIFLIMEYACGGELFDYIVQEDRLQEKEACHFYKQIVAGIEFLHSKGIAHRDLKPENLLLDKNKDLKIVDFGLSNMYQPGETLKTACGSPCYAAPEMIAGKRYQGIKVDIWSSGVTLYAMLCGFLPFEDPNTALLYKKILKGDFELPDFLTNRSIRFLKQLLCTDPAQRLSLAQIKEHSWFTQFDPKQGLSAEKLDNEVAELSLAVSLPSQKKKDMYNTQMIGSKPNTSLALNSNAPKENATQASIVKKDFEAKKFQIPDQKAGQKRANFAAPSSRFGGTQTEITEGQKMSPAIKVAKHEHHRVIQTAQKVNSEKKDVEIDNNFGNTERAQISTQKQKNRQSKALPLPSQLLAQSSKTAQKQQIQLIKSSKVNQKARPQTSFQIQQIGQKRQQIVPPKSAQGQQALLHQQYSMQQDSAKKIAQHQPSSITLQSILATSPARHQFLTGSVSSFAMRNSNNNNANQRTIHQEDASSSVTGATSEVLSKSDHKKLVVQRSSAPATNLVQNSLTSTIKGNKQLKIGFLQGKNGSNQNAIHPTQSFSQAGKQVKIDQNMKLAASRSDSTETAKTLEYSSIPTNHPNQSNHNSNLVVPEMGASPSTGGSSDALKTNKDLLKNNLSKIAKLSKVSPNQLTLTQTVSSQKKGRENQLDQKVHFQKNQYLVQSHLPLRGGPQTISSINKFSPKNLTSSMVQKRRYSQDENIFETTSQTRTVRNNHQGSINRSLSNQSGSTVREGIIQTAIPSSTSMKKGVKKQQIGQKQGKFAKNKHLMKSTHATVHPYTVMALSQTNADSHSTLRGQLSNATSKERTINLKQKPSSLVVVHSPTSSVINSGPQTVKAAVQMKKNVKKRQNQGSVMIWSGDRKRTSLASIEQGTGVISQSKHAKQKELINLTQKQLLKSTLSVQQSLVSPKQSLDQQQKSKDIQKSLEAKVKSLNQQKKQKLQKRKWSASASMEPNYANRLVQSVEVLKKQQQQSSEAQQMNTIDESNHKMRSFTGGAIPIDWISEMSPDKILQTLFKILPILGAQILKINSRYFYEIGIDQTNGATSKQPQLNSENQLRVELELMKLGQNETAFTMVRILLDKQRQTEQSENDLALYGKFCLQLQKGLGLGEI